MPKFVPEDFLMLFVVAWVAICNGVSIGGLVPGPRLVVIAHESNDTNAVLSRTLINLRDGKAAEALKAGSHTLDILDDENPSFSKWQPALTGVPLPAVLIIAPPDKVLAKETLPANATADSVLAILKKNGG